jgi:hypothetical protein
MEIFNQLQKYKQLTSFKKGLLTVLLRWKQKKNIMELNGEKIVFIFIYALVVKN